MPISKELCAKLDLPIEIWGTIRSAVVFYCTKSGYRMNASEWLMNKAMEFALDDEELFLEYYVPRLEFTDISETDLPPEVMSIAKAVQGVRPLTDAQAVTFVVEVVRASIRTSHDLDAQP